EAARGGGGDAVVRAWAAWVDTGAFRGLLVRAVRGVTVGVGWRVLAASTGGAGAGYGCRSQGRWRAGQRGGDGLGTRRKEEGFWRDDGPLRAPSGLQR
ncbi:hypothetical protein ACJRO7_012678, partial [Eucalyptus globulus]